MLSIMRMRSHKQLPRSGEDYTGCFTAFVSIFVHRNSSHKLLSDKKSRGHKRSGSTSSARSLDFSGSTETLLEKTKGLDENVSSILTRSGMPSVRMLIEEEMSVSNTQDIENSHSEDSSSSTDFHSATFMVQFYCENCQYQENQDDHEMFESFLQQKLIDDKQNISKEFMDALDTLSSNRELFLKLVQDQKSVQGDKKKSRQSFFKKKEKSKETKGSDIERPNSRFSYKQIKSRLRQAIGKSVANERNDIELPTQSPSPSCDNDLSEPLQNTVCSQERDMSTCGQELELTSHQNRVFDQQNVCDETQVNEETIMCSTSGITKSDETRAKEDVEEEEAQAIQNQDILENIGAYKEEECNTKIEQVETPVTTTSSLSRILDIKQLENPQDMLEIPERPSPVSVLEAVFSEDTIIDDDYSDSTEKPEQVLENLVETDISGFVTTLLENSGLNFDEALELWNLPDQILENYPLRSNDTYIVVDCINEVLAETQERLLGCTPWISLIKPDTMPLVSRKESVIREVCRGVHNKLYEFEVEKWSDVFESEDVCFEIADGVLDEMIDEAVLEFGL